MFKEPGYRGRVSAVLQFLLHVPGPVVLGTIGALVFSEAAFFLGFVVPGETAVLLGGFLSSTGKLSVALLAVVVVLAAVMGDSVGYEVGKRFFGPRILSIPMMAKHEVRIRRAQDFLRLRGGIAVFLGRFTAFFRAMMPALAGASEMHYPKFLVWNAAGGVVWGTTFVSLGYLFSDTYKKVEHTLGRWFAIGLAVIVVVAAVVWKIRSERTPEREGESPDA